MEHFLNLRRGAFCRLLLLTIALVAAGSAWGQADDKLRELAQRIGKRLVEKQRTKLAVSDFSDLQGQPTSLGRYLAESLSVEFVNTPGISVVDRSHLKTILAEHKLSEEGLINPETAKKLGQFAGVDVLVIGTITILQDGVSVTVKGVSTETAEVIAADRVILPKGLESQIGSVQATETKKAPASDAPKKAAKAELLTVSKKGLAAKSMGELHVVLTSMQPTKVNANGGITVDGIQCVFEVTNRSPEHKGLIGLNRESEVVAQRNKYDGRTQILDTNGNVWVLYEINGFQLIGAGNGNPNNIAQLITKEMSAPQRSWTGTLHTIKPGDTSTVTITYGPKPIVTERPIFRSADLPPDRNAAFQLQCEFITGRTANTSAKKLDPEHTEVSLQTVLWQNLRLGVATR